jgi:hypothetical protein
VSLADVLAYAVSYALYLERFDRPDHPNWRKTWVQQAAETRVRFVERLKVPKARPLRHGSRDVVPEERR